MNIYELPTTVEANGQTLHIRNDGDWRMVIDVNIALTDPELTEQERAMVALMIFYDCDIADIRDPQAALDGALKFIAIDEDGAPQTKKPKLIDWQDDAAIIISGINSVLGREVRAERYMHWWTFTAAYMAIGDSVLATVVSIRDKIARGKKLEKYEKDFKRDNPQYFGVNKRQAAAEHALLLEMLDNTE